jgi:polysaccharide deacetylase family protein (PEP-CTERM system associated)
MDRCPHYFTVDVEDYFHSEDPDVAGWDRHELRVERSTRAVVEACAEAGVRATFFVLGWVAERCPALVREIAAAGHTVASHGYEHRFIYHQSPAEFGNDVRRAKDLLESLTGTSVLGYRAPYFSIISRSLWAYDVLHAAGYRYSSSVFPGSNPRYGIPGHSQQPVTVRTASGGTIREIPITTFASRIGCGGVYFRALPYPLFASLMSGNGRRGNRSVFYIHPWELDAGKPPARGSLGLGLRHAVGVRGAGARLKRLLRDFAFEPVEAALDTPAATAALAEPVHA